MPGKLKFTIKKAVYCPYSYVLEIVVILVNEVSAVQSGVACHNRRKGKH